MFPGSIIEWNQFQIEFVSWCEFYHNIYTMPEPPPRDVIENDAKLDAYLKTLLNQSHKQRMQTQRGR